MSFNVVVPARLGSTRLANKPLADIGGRPMLAHVLDRAAESGATRVIAAVDSEQIAATAREAGFEAAMTGECSCGTERVAAAAAMLKLSGVVVNLQGDEPFINPATIAAVASRAASAPWCATAAAPMPAAGITGSTIVRVAVAKDGAALYFSRQPIPHQAPIHHAHLGIYAFSSPESLAKMAALAPCSIEQDEKLEQLRWLWHGYRIEVVEVEEFSCGIDTPEELEKARAEYEASSQ